MNMTTEEMAKKADQWAHDAFTADDAREPLMAIARRLRLLEAVNTTRETWQRAETECCNSNLRTDRVTLSDAALAEHLKAVEALDADERGGNPSASTLT